MAETDVPQAGGDDWKRVSPLAALDFLVVMVRHGFIQALPAFAVLVASAFNSERLDLAWVLGLGVLVVLAGAAWSVLSYLRFGYREQPGRIEVRKGVLHRETLKVAFDRIQNVAVHEPFYMRPFGMAAVGIDTAGSSGKEIRLPGIALEPARQMRQRLVLAAEGHDGEHGGTVEADDGREHVRGQVLLRLSRQDVVIAGLTANFMIWVAVAFATVMGSGDTAENLLAWVGARLDLAGIADALRQTGGPWLLGLAASLAFLLAVMVLPLISVIGALFRYDGFTLSVDGDRFRCASGLLSRHDNSVRTHKIQAVTWKQSAVGLLFARFNLQLRQASAGTAAGAEIQPGAPGQRAFQVPSLRPGEATDLTAKFLPGCDAGAPRLTGVDGRAFMLVNAGFVLAPITLGMVTAALLVHPAFLVVWCVIATLVIAITWRCWKQAGWAVVGDHAVTRRGFIGSSSTWFPLSKVQRVDLVQTPLQARRGLAHLVIHLASHSMTVFWMRFEDAERLRDLAIAQAETSRQPWF
ncbi:PH domain-containing protein [Marinihelvus fidelis]|nr:PH domain-containing protein [Marinihelvus fidelis]